MLLIAIARLLVDPQPRVLRPAEQEQAAGIACLREILGLGPDAPAFSLGELNLLGHLGCLAGIRRCALGSRAELALWDWAMWFSTQATVPGSRLAAVRRLLASGLVEYVAYALWRRWDLDSLNESFPEN